MKIGTVAIIILALVAVVAMLNFSSIIEPPDPDDDTETEYVWSDDNNYDGLNDATLKDTRLVVSGVPVDRIVKIGEPAQMYLYWQTTDMGIYSDDNMASQNGALKVAYVVRHDNHQGSYVVSYTTWACDVHRVIEIGDETWAPGTYYVEMFTDGGFPLGYECQAVYVTLEVVR
jgi:hypothetical protein